jgi:hypothetical protein
MAKTPAVALAPGVWRIPLLGDFVNGFILRDDDGQVTLVDMGVKQSGPRCWLRWHPSAQVRATSPG